jgi:hypothetical protein
METYPNVITAVATLKIEWHMVKVTKTTADQRWGKNEHHFHFKCAKVGIGRK